MWVEVVYDTSTGAIINAYRSDSQLVAYGVPMSGVQSSALPAGQAQAVVVVPASLASFVYANLDQILNAVKTRNINLSKVVTWLGGMPVLASGMKVMEIK